MNNPSAPENNKHHTDSMGSEEDYNFEVLGLARGSGDPDYYGYTGMEETADTQ